MEREVERSFDKINMRLDLHELDLKDIRKEQSDHNARMRLNEQNIESLRNDMKAIKSDTRWILRLIVSAIVVALLNLIIT